MQLVAKIFPKNEVWFWYCIEKRMKYVTRDNFVA